MPELGELVPHAGQMCRVVGITYREGGLYKLEQPDGGVLDDVKLVPRTETQMRPRLVKGDW
jgi:hypothetical protein